MAHNRWMLAPPQKALVFTRILNLYFEFVLLVQISEESLPVNVFCGIVAGIVSSSFANPTDVLKVFFSIYPCQVEILPLSLHLILVTAFVIAATVTEMLVADKSSRFYVIFVLFSVLFSPLLLYVRL